MAILIIRFYLQELKKKIIQSTGLDETNSCGGIWTSIFMIIYFSLHRKKYARAFGFAVFIGVDILKKIKS